MGNFNKILRSIKEVLKDSPRGMTITEIATQINLNRNSTARYLDVLLISGQVEMKNVGAAKLYFLSPRLPVEAVLDLSTEGFLMLNSKLQIIRVNEAFTKLVKNSSTKFVGSTLSKHEISFLLDDIAANSISEAIGGKQVSYETRTQINGIIRFLKLKFVPTTFDDGDAGVTIIIEDISERKRSDEKIIKQAEFLNLIMESVAHPFYVIDANDYSIKMSNKSARLGFLSPDSTCYSLTHKSSSPCSGDIHPCPLKKVKMTKKPVVVEHTHHTVSGGTRHLEIHAHPIFDEDGRVSQMIEYNIDITERKQIEEDEQNKLKLLNTALDSIDHAILIIQHNQILHSNLLMDKLLGYSSSGYNLSQILQSKYIKRFQKKNYSSKPITFELIRNDNTLLTVECIIRPLSKSDDAILFIVT